MNNVGIIGCGKMGKVYARWFNQNPETCVKAFYNRTHSVAEELSKQYEGSQAVKKWEDIVSDKNIDIIGVCTPSNEHYFQLLECIKNDKHVLLEKPVAKDVLQCREMAEAVSNSNIKVMVGFQMRYHPVVLKVNEILEKAGNIFNIKFYFGMYRPENTWRHSISQGGGVFKELGSHLVDLTCMWLGDISGVFSINRIFGQGREVEDFCDTLLEFENEACAGISCNYWDRDGRNIVCKIMAEKMQVTFSFSSYDPKDSKIEITDDNGNREVDVEMPDADDIDVIYPGHLDSFKKEIDYFVESILNDSDIGFSFENGLRSMEIINAAYDSQRTGKRIENVYAEYDGSQLKNCFGKGE